MKSKPSDTRVRGNKAWFYGEAADELLRLAEDLGVSTDEVVRRAIKLAHERMLAERAEMVGSENTDNAP